MNGNLDPTDHTDRGVAVQVGQEPHAQLGSKLHSIAIVSSAPSIAGWTPNTNRGTCSEIRKMHGNNNINITTTAALRKDGNVIFMVILYQHILFTVIWCQTYGKVPLR